MWWVVAAAAPLGPADVAGGGAEREVGLSGGAAAPPVLFVRRCEFEEMVVFFHRLLGVSWREKFGSSRTGAATHERDSSVSVG